MQSNIHPLLTNPIVREKTWLSIKSKKKQYLIMLHIFRNFLKFKKISVP